VPSAALTALNATILDLLVLLPFILPPPQTHFCDAAFLSYHMRKRRINCAFINIMELFTKVLRLTFIRNKKREVNDNEKDYDYDDYFNFTGCYDVGWLFPQGTGN